MNQRVSQAKRLIEAFIALMVGRRARIHWDGSGSVDNDGEVHLPPPQTGDAEEIALLTRLAVHESGHLLATDNGFADRLTREELAIFNVLEDPRMERSQVQRYPGASLVLSRGLDGMLQRIGDHLDEKLEGEPETAVQLDLLLRGFLAVAPHGPFARYAPQILERIAPRIAEPQRAAIAEALAQLPMLASSLEAEDVARAFVARMREEQQSPDVPQAAPAEEPQQDRPEPPEQEHEQQDRSQPGQPPAEQTEQERAGDRDAAASQQDQPPSEPQAQDAGGQQPRDGSPAGSGDEGAQAAAPDPAKDGEGQGSNPPGSDHSAAASGHHGGSGTRETDERGDEGQAGTGEGGASSDKATPGSRAHGGEGEQPNTGSGHQTTGAPGPGVADAGGDGAQFQDSASASVPGTPGETASSGQQETQPAPSASGQEAGAAEPLDLGRLLREAHVARYGATAKAGQPGGDEQADAAGAELTDKELERVEALLAQADPNASLDELVEASLVALAASDDECDEDSSSGEGAGMSLACEPTPPTNLIEARLQGVQSRLVTVLQRELQDKRRRPTRIAYNGSRVMPQRFWRLDALGDTKVMLHRRAATGIDAAATVLLDSSGSMRGQLTVAAQVTMAFSLALQRLGVRTRVARFPGRETVTETLQRFGESARSCVHRCGELTASGGTPVGAAVALETPALLQQRKLKNILAVVTDDEPGDSHTLLSALEEAAQLDVLVVGVGIGCDIRRWIALSVGVQDVNELPEALARLFRENITEKLAA